VVFNAGTSLALCGGATFVVASNFLMEHPCVRLYRLRKAIPNLLFKTLLRASHTVGYKNYPADGMPKFAQESAK
ncbi:hypothetical protein, partial [Staphylococcus aureus]